LVTRFKYIYNWNNNLKGVLWETIAVSELRGQAEQLAKKLLKIND